MKISVEGQSTIWNKSWKVKQKYQKDRKQERKGKAEVQNKRSKISRIPEREQKGRNYQRFQNIFPRTEDPKSPN